MWQPYKSHKDFIIAWSSKALFLDVRLMPLCINFEWEQTTAKPCFSGSADSWRLKVDFLNCPQKEKIQNYISFFTHLVFNLNSKFHRKVLPDSISFLPFNSIHLGWRVGGHIEIHNFESGSTKNHFSFWTEDFNMIYFLIKCINSINWLIFFLICLYLLKCRSRYKYEKNIWHAYTILHRQKTFYLSKKHQLQGQFQRATTMYIYLSCNQYICCTNMLYE